MDILQEIWRLILLTVTRPADAAREVLAFELDRKSLWLALLLVICLSTLAHVATVGVRIQMPFGPETLILTPMTYAFILGAGFVLTVFAIHYTGAAFGGIGRFTSAIAIVVWIELVSLVFRVVLTAISYINPNVAGILSLIGMIILIRAIAYFVDVSHGFNNPLKSLGILLLGVFGLIMGLSIIISVIGAATGVINFEGL